MSMTLHQTLTTHQPVPSNTGHACFATQSGVPLADALEQVDHTLLGALAVLDQVPLAQGTQREELAYASAELLRSAHALLTACRGGLEGENA
jgi:hypothetical protein